MKTTKLTTLLFALFALLPSLVKAQDVVTLASWGFENEADQTVWFNSAAPNLQPDECVGEKASYVMTGLSTGRYWQTCNGYQNRVLRIENTEANAIADYTDASKHNVYYEAQFPTTGYDNISLEFAIAYGGNAAATMEVVASVDGGSSWFGAGTITLANTWWTYNKQTISLSAKNKDLVKVRIIGGNEYASNWNMDYFTVKGSAVQGPKPIDAKGATATWAFNAIDKSPTAATLSEPDAVSASAYALGTNLHFTKTRTQGSTTYGGSVTLSNVQPYEAIGTGEATAVAQNAVVFTLVPKKGVTFKPTKLSFNTCKVGTSGGTWYVDVKAGEKSVRLASAFDPARDDYSKAEYAINGIDASAEKVEVYFYVTNLAANKEIALADVVLTGDFVGTPESVPSYTLKTALGTPGAGNVTVNPSGAEFDEGTEITVSASENFGYHFASWTDENGNVVSTENPYTFAISGNTVLNAIYTQKNVYALNIELEGGANTNGVLFSPVGNVVEGVHYYEEGTEVELTTVNNRILTFTNWEDNTTSLTRSIKMDGEKNVKATFSLADFIVGWDLYYDNPGSERAADYKDESENAGLLSLRKADGTTTGWLQCGSQKGGQNGKYAARVWKVKTEGYYFEISFSSKGYSNLKLSAAVGNDYNSCAVVNAQYSTDGTNYQTFGKYNIPNRGWDLEEFDLPADAAGKDKVWIRFMGEDWSNTTGVESDYDGTAVAEIYVLADKDSNSDEIAPKLVSSIPANGATGASATGSIILTFDEKVVAGTTSATLNGETLRPTISGKTAVYQYSGLKYNTEYTFTLPAGAITDRNGNAFEGCTISFTTMERTQPEAKLYDAVVAQDGSGDYTSLQAAIDAAPTKRVKPWLIFVKAGKYHEHIDIPQSKPYIHIIGQDRNKVEVYDDRLCGGDNAVHVSIGATVVAHSNNLYFEGLNLVNSYGRDQNNGPQALALNTEGDRIVFNKVGLISYQDTWITTSTSNNRHFIKNSWIEGAVDFIYNSGNVYLDQDTINIVRKTGGFIVAPSHAADVEWGYVFMNNVITAKGITGVEKQPAELNCKPSDVSVWLGRPWHNNPKTVFINTKAEVTIPATGWYETMGGLPVLWADYNTVDGNGNPIDLSNRRDTYYKTENGEKIYGKAKNFLTDEEAAQYTIKNVMGGKDQWQPDLICEACDAPAVTVTAGVLSWEAVPYAICYVITKGDEVVAFTTDCEYTTDGSNADYKVQAVNEFGGLSAYSTQSDVDAIHDINVVDTTTDDAPCYNLAGMRVSNSARGIIIKAGRKIMR